MRVVIDAVGIRGHGGIAILCELVGYVSFNLNGTGCLCVRKRFKGGVQDHSQGYQERILIQKSKTIYAQIQQPLDFQ